MIASCNHEPRNRIADMVEQVRRKGVRLWCDQGQLRYEAPKGALTTADIQSLRACKADVIAYLEAVSMSDLETKPARPARINRVPLTFSQLSHWQWFNLGKRRHLRQIASATRIQGRLDVDAFRRGIAEIIHRHDALRTRIVIVDGGPLQEVSVTGSCKLEVVDLTVCQANLREEEIARQIEQFVLQPVDVTCDPLLGLRLLQLGDDEHVLLAAMEHIISDMFSLSILLRDLFTAYRDILQGRPLSLPEIPLQFIDHAIQQSATRTLWLQRHGVYWRERLRDCGRVRFPADARLLPNPSPGWDALPVKIGGELKLELREWCRTHRTTLAMSVFTAYAALVLRWCNVPQMVVQYVTDGRVDAQLHNTIGAFGYLMSLRIELQQGGNFLDLLQHVTQEYCGAQENADAAYIEAQEPRPEVLRNCAFNWLPQGFVSWGRQGSKVDLSDLERSGDAIVCTPVPFKHPMLKILDWDREPFVLLFDTDEDISGDVYFPTERFSPRTIQRFGRNFLWFVDRLLKQPTVPVKDVLLM